MTEADLNAEIEREVDAELEAELEARKAKMRADIVVRRAREASRAHYDRINAKHPIETVLAGLTPEQEAARQAGMAERRRAAAAHLDEVNARPIPGVRASLRPRAVDGAGGGVGFTIK